jgi:hypothetical protein
MKIKLSLAVLVIAGIVSTRVSAQQIDAPRRMPGSINGTVMTVNDSVISRAVVSVEGQNSGERQSLQANDSGFFEFHDLESGIPWRVHVSVPGFAEWTSPPIVLNPGQFIYLTDIRLHPGMVQTTVTASLPPDDIATEEVHAEEQQRVWGVIPNFYISYDSQAAPLTSKLKFELALRASVDPVKLAGAALVAATDQAGNTPDYREGARGYAQRLGANYANGFSDIMTGGALLPSLLHQDPRYFYQGTGSVRSRILHAIAAPVLCRGDDGHQQPNYSSVGGDLISGAISNLYYPTSNRGPRLVFGTALIDAGARATNGLIQEFLLRQFTTHANNSH